MEIHGERGGKETPRKAAHGGIHHFLIRSLIHLASSSLAGHSFASPSIAMKDLKMTRPPNSKKPKPLQMLGAGRAQVALA